MTICKNPSTATEFIDLAYPVLDLICLTTSVLYSSCPVLFCSLLFFAVIKACSFSMPDRVIVLGMNISSPFLSICPRQPLPCTLHIFLVCSAMGATISLTFNPVSNVYEGVPRCFSYSECRVIDP